MTDSEAQTDHSRPAGSVSSVGPVQPAANEWIDSELASKEMTGSDLSAQESATSPREPLHPLDGGIWRPVSPQELLRRNLPSDEDEGDRKPVVKVTVQRRQQLERYLRDRPADIDAYLELAVIYRDLGRSVEAKRILKTALEVEPDHPTILWELEEAELARSLQQLRDVREVAEKLVTAEASRELERAKLDWANRRSSVCRARLARDPSNDHLRVVLAEALRELGNYAEAIEVLQPALQSDSESPLAYLILGNCKQQEGDNLGALSAWRHAALRREVPAPPKIRIPAIKSAIATAESLGLTGTLKIYRQALQIAEQMMGENELSQQ